MRDAELPSNHFDLLYKPPPNLHSLSSSMIGQLDSRTSHSATIVVSPLGGSLKACISATAKSISNQRQKNLFLMSIYKYPSSFTPFLHRHLSRLSSISSTTSFVLSLYTLSPDDLLSLTSFQPSTSLSANMQFTLITVLSLVAVTFAIPVAIPQRLDGMLAFVLHVDL